jgi:hypothetical protein
MELSWTKRNQNPDFGLWNHMASPPGGITQTTHLSRKSLLLVRFTIKAVDIQTQLLSAAFHREASVLMMALQSFWILKRW